MNNKTQARIKFLVYSFFIWFFVAFGSGAITGLIIAGIYDKKIDLSIIKTLFIVSLVLSSAIVILYILAMSYDSIFGKPNDR